MYLHIEMFATYILESPLLFKNDVLIDSPTFQRHTFTWPTFYNYIISDFLRYSRSDRPLLSWNDFPQVSSFSAKKAICKSEIWNTHIQHLFFDCTISIYNSLSTPAKIIKDIMNRNPGLNAGFQDFDVQILKTIWFVSKKKMNMY